MTNNRIIISRIQNRRGRRENLPQPLLAGEVALTADTDQVWIGGDADLSAPSVRVYSDKSSSTAQTIVDTSIVEAVFDTTFSAANFATLVADLIADNTITLASGDILWDDTFRGEILSITIDTPGTGYTTGDAITAISPTGSGFVGTVIDTAGAITGINIVSGGQNYSPSSTTFSIAGGTGGVLSVDNSDIHATTVHIAVRNEIDSNNTIANIQTALTNVTASIAAKLISSGALGGTFVSRVLTLDTQLEASNIATLINRVNADTPGEVTGLVSTNLNIEITGVSGALTVTAGDIDSEAATNGQVLTADGAGGASFEDAAGGGGPTVESGSFVATYDGMTSTVTTTFFYTRLGDFVSLRRPGGFAIGTSNSISFGFTGIPANIQPTSVKVVRLGGLAVDDGAFVSAEVVFNGDDSVAFRKLTTDVNGDVTATASFTNSGQKGLDGFVTISYTLD